MKELFFSLFLWSESVYERKSKLTPAGRLHVFIYGMVADAARWVDSNWGKKKKHPHSYLHHSIASKATVTSNIRSIPYLYLFILSEVCGAEIRGIIYLHQNVDTLNSDLLSSYVTQ